VRVILENYLVQLAREKASTLKLKDYQPGDWDGIYGADKIINCFIVHVPNDHFFGVGASRMIAISKETGEIVMDGLFRE